MSTPVIITMICDGPALLIIGQNEDDNDARRYGSLVTPRRYVINVDLRRHFSLIFSNPLMMLPFALDYHITSRDDIITMIPPTPWSKDQENSSMIRQKRRESAAPIRC